jgi:hypothetical protein
MVALLATHQRAHACGVDGCEFRTDYKQHLKRHQAHEHGIGDVEGENERRKQMESEARRPVHRCGVEGCEFETKGERGVLQRHLEAVHGVVVEEIKEGRGKVEEIRKKQRGFRARRPGLVCAVDGCEFTGSFRATLEEHLACVHGGEVDKKVATAIRGMQRGWRAWSRASWVPSYPRRPSVVHRAEESAQRLRRCGVEGCEHQTKHIYSLKRHQALVHGIGDVEAAEERRRKKRERAARQPILRCCVDGCEYQTKYTNDIKNHQARVHGIDQLTAVGRRRARAFRGRTLAVFHQRPVGRAPKGMDWDNTVGKWVPTIIDPAHASPPYE